MASSDGAYMIREMTRGDFEAFWPDFLAIIQAQETYAFDPQMTLDEAYHLWCEIPQLTFVYEEDGAVLGSYYLKPNALGPGQHICNCGYMVGAAARGRGLAAQLCIHSQKTAAELGYRAIQFNSVVASNHVAVRLWQKLGFEIVGTVPEAYRHKQLGYVDLLIMHKALR